jgi:hypothetical protein
MDNLSLGVRMYSTRTATAPEVMMAIIAPATKFHMFSMVFHHCCPVKLGSPARNGMILNRVLSI